MNIISILFVIFVIYDCYIMWLLYLSYRSRKSYSRYKNLVNDITNIDSNTLSESDRIKVNQAYKIFISIYDHKYMDTIYNYMAYDDVVNGISDLLINIIPSIKKEKRVVVIDNIIG